MVEKLILISLGALVLLVVVSQFSGGVKHVFENAGQNIERNLGGAAQASLASLPKMDSSDSEGKGVSESEWKRAQAAAAQYCPKTLAKNADIDPSKLTRSKAVQICHECLGEMGPLQRMIASLPVNAELDKRFPKH